MKPSANDHFSWTVLSSGNQAEIERWESCCVALLEEVEGAVRR